MASRDKTKAQEYAAAWWRNKYKANPAFRAHEIKRKQDAYSKWSDERKAHDRTYKRTYMRDYRKRKAAETTP